MTSTRYVAAETITARTRLLSDLPGTKLTATVHSHRARAGTQAAVQVPEPDSSNGPAEESVGSYVRAKDAGFTCICGNTEGPIYLSEKRRAKELTSICLNRLILAD
jgi:hypothetical protein